jgi:sn-glycerol 3-phosphate transport system permease protein
VGDHVVLILGALLMMAPIWVTFATASHEDLTVHREGLQFWPGGQLGQNFGDAMFREGGFTGEVTGTLMLQNSLILGIGFALGKIIQNAMLQALGAIAMRLALATWRSG